MTVTREEFNGLGRRVSGVELLKPKVDRNERDIETLFREFDEKTTKFSDKADKYAEKSDKVFNGIIIGAVVLVLGLIIKELLIK